MSHVYKMLTKRALLHPLLYAFYLISVPPHSTTVKPPRSGDVRVWGSISTAVSLEYHAIKMRSVVSGDGVTSSGAASVYDAPWKEITLYSLSCISGSQ